MSWWETTGAFVSIMLQKTLYVYPLDTRAHVPEVCQWLRDVTAKKEKMKTSQECCSKKLQVAALLPLKEVFCIYTHGYKQAFTVYGTHSFPQSLATSRIPYTKLASTISIVDNHQPVHRVGAWSPLCLIHRRLS